MCQQHFERLYAFERLAPALLTLTIGRGSGYAMRMAGSRICDSSSGRSRRKRSVSAEERIRPTMDKPTPLSVYVVFNPASDESCELAESLNAWFRLKDDDGNGTEAGLPIWFRVIPDLESPDGLLPRIAFEGASLNVVVVLIDDQMVADDVWRRSLQTLSAHTVEKQSGNCLLLPVPLDSSAFRLSFLFAERNRLFAGLSRPSSEPTALKSATQAELAARSTRVRARSRILRRGVTEALTRELRKTTATGDWNVDEPPRPLDVFVSHAKGDGRGIARSIRDGLADFGQLKTWFDENDLPPGYKWESPMVSAAGENTAALVSVVTDLYPSRPWCRREVNLARTPRKLDLPNPPPNVSAWTVQPMVAVSHAGNAWHRPMAQLAQVPHLPWRNEDGKDGCLEDVVDRLLLEALLVEFYRGLAPRIAAQVSETKQRVALLTWVPDPWTLTQVRSLLLAQSDEPCVIAYPGYGLRSAEVKELEDFAAAMEVDQSPPGKSFCTLIAQERLGELNHTVAATDIAISGGGTSEDVATAGLGIGHVNDVIMRLTRRLLQHGHTLHYGGSLSDYESNLTKSMIDVAVGWDRLNDAEAATSARSDDSPFVNYAAWPFYRFVTTRQRAELQGICEFREIDPNEGAPVAANAADLMLPTHAVAAANALTAMRTKVSANTKLRIVIAGKLRNWRGWVPGILEEFAVSCAAARNGPHRPLVFGGFGGASALIAKFLLDKNEEWPKEFGFAYAWGNNPRFRELLLDQPKHRPMARKYFAHVQDEVRRFRERLRDAPEEVNKVWVAALRCGAPAAAIALAVDATRLLDEWK